MPTGMQGGFNLCGVHDLAAGTIPAVDKGRADECCILVNEPIIPQEMCGLLQKACDAKRISCYLPLGLAAKIAQTVAKQAEKTGKNR